MLVTKSQTIKENVVLHPLLAKPHTLFFLILASFRAPSDLAYQI